MYVEECMCNKEGRVSISKADCTCMYVHVPVANSLMNIGLFRGNSSSTTWAGPNMADIRMLDMAPK
jgi:hypothetical protein